MRKRTRQHVNRLAAQHAAREVNGSHLHAFERFARTAALMAGKPATFFTAVGIIVAWLATGPIFGFSDTWQLIINTGTTIVTFLMVFLLQHSQNRDTMALQIKLAELVFALKDANNELATAEDLSEEELSRLHQAYAHKAEQTLKHLEAKRGSDKDHRRPLDRRTRQRAS